MMGRFEVLIHMRIMRTGINKLYDRIRFGSIKVHWAINVPPNIRLPVPAFRAEHFRQESVIHDNLQEEMLRIVLKRFIITCTRIARQRFGVGQEKEKTFDIIRQYYVLVDRHFKEKKQVQDYADILCRSPKTLSNLFSTCGLPSPLRVIHDRIEAEAMRLLLYTHKSAKEISSILGFEDLSAFSRFFKKMTGESVSDYRKRVKREELPTVAE